MTRSLATTPEGQAMSSRPPAAPWLALLAGPLSFGIAGPALILPTAAADLRVPVAAGTRVVAPVRPRRAGRRGHLDRDRVRSRDRGRHTADGRADRAPGGARGVALERGARPARDD